MEGTSYASLERRRDLIRSTLDRDSNSDASADELGATGREVDEMLRHGMGAQPQWAKAGFALPCRPAAARLRRQPHMALDTDAMLRTLFAPDILYFF